MKIILASDISFLVNHGYNLTGISKCQMRIGYITTASKKARDKTFLEIEVADWADSSRSRFGVTDFSALNYVPFVLKAHYKDEIKNEVKEKMKTLKYPLRILRDGQGILVENDNYTFIGEEVTI